MARTRVVWQQQEWDVVIGEAMRGILRNERITLKRAQRNLFTGRKRAEHANTRIAFRQRVNEVLGETGTGRAWEKRPIPIEAHYAARLWLDAHEPAPITVKRPEPYNQQPAAVDVAPALSPALDAEPRPIESTEASRLADLTVAYGADILSRILAHPDVLAAAATLAQQFTGRAPKQEPLALWPQPAPEPDKVRQRRVVVAGVKGVQGPELIRTHGERLDLRFWSTDESNARLKSLVDGADEIILMASFINHSVQQMAHSRKPRSHVHVVHGGLSALRGALDRLMA